MNVKVKVQLRLLLNSTLFKISLMIWVEVSDVSSISVTLEWQHFLFCQQVISAKGGSLVAGVGGSEWDLSSQQFMLLPAPASLATPVI